MNEKYVRVPVDLINSLCAEIERNTCEHESTHRGGAIWEICDDCGAKWADGEGGKPEFKWPGCYLEAQALIESAPEPASAEPVAEVIPNVVGVDIAWIHLPSEGKRPPVGTKLYPHPPAQQWVKCSERMPDVGVPVLAYGVDEYPVVAYITAIGWACYAADEYLSGEPTCWMPLPLPPGEE